MMKGKSLIKAFILIACIFSFFVGVLKVSAADKFEIVQDTGGKKVFGENDGYVEKSIIAQDLENGEITIGILVNNSRSTEIMFVLDNSTQIEGADDLKTLINSSLKTLVANLHDNGNLKTGVMHMHPYGDTTTPATNGGVISALNADETATNTGLDTYLSTAGADGQDFIEVLTAANSAFDEDTENKIIVLITTGIDGTHVTEYKDALTEIGTEAKIVSIVVDNTNIEIEGVFGTEEDPNTVIYYNTESENLDATINTLIRVYIESLLPSDKEDMSIQDLFTKNIIDNFTIEYVGAPTAGTVGEFDDENGLFTWTVGDLENNSSALFTYKLTLNDNYDTSLEDIILNTNESLNISYTDSASEPINVIYDVNPTIRILTSLVNPKTGLYDYFIPASLIFCISVLTISIVKRREVFVNI